MPEWVHILSAWTSAHKDQLTLWSTIASGVGAVASAFAALVVMLLTRTLAKDNALLRKAGTEPEVVAYLLPDERHLNIVNLVVANVGSGPARNVELEFIGDLDLFFQRGVRLLRRPRKPVLPWLPQGERYSQMFGNSFELMVDPIPSAFEIRVHFANSGGRTMTTLSRIDVAQFDGLARLHSIEHDTAEALKSIAKTLGGWTGRRRL